MEITQQTDNITDIRPVQKTGGYMEIILEILEKKYVSKQDYDAIF